MRNPLRLLARPMLGSMFVMGGLDALRSPEGKVSTAEDVAQPIAEQVPPLQGADTETLVRLNGAVQVAGGTLLTLGKLPRLASAALAATLVPTTLAGHRFWEIEDEGERANQQVHFFKNLSMLGGLILAALDTEGRPGLAWRTQHAAEHAGLRAGHTRREAKLAARLAKAEAKARSREATAAMKTAGALAAQEVRHQADSLGTRTELAKKKLTPDVVDAKRLVSAIRDRGED